MKKLLIALVSLAMVVAIGVTAVFVGRSIAQDVWENPITRFSKMSKSHTFLVLTEGEGSVSETEEYYEDGSLVTLEATADEGYQFTGWYNADGTYLSAESVYSFTIGENTELTAKFSEKPEDMSGESNILSSLKNVGQDFSFDIVCERDDAEAFIKENLKIVDSQFAGTEFEDLAKVDFKIEKADDSNTYKVTVADDQKLEDGITYTAKLENNETPTEEDPEEEPEEEDPEEEPEEEEEEEEEEYYYAPPTTLDAEISLNNGSELDFSVEKDETDIQEFNDGIIFFTMADVKELQDDGLMEGEEGDREDYVVLNDVSSLEKDLIFCVYSGENNADGTPVLDGESFFAKVKSITGNKVVYGTPELSEVYSKLEIFYSKEAELNGVKLEEGDVEAVRRAVLENESFQKFISAAELAVKNSVGDEYQVELLNATNFSERLKVNLVPVIKGNTVNVKITATLVTPVTDSNGNSYAATVKMDFDKNITLSKHADIRLREVSWLKKDVSYFDFSVGISDEESVVINVLIDENVPKSLSSALVKEKFTKEYNKISKTVHSDAFEKNGYGKGANTRVRLFSTTYDEGSMEISLDVDFQIRLDIRGTTSLTAYTKNEVEVGIRSEGTNSARPYTNAYSSSTASDYTLIGESDIQTTVGVDATFVLKGFSKYVRTNFRFSAGTYYNGKGLVNLKSSHFAGTLTSGASYRVERLTYKVFSTHGSWTMRPTKNPIYSYGMDNAILAYVEQDKLLAGKVNVACIAGDIDLFGLEELKVNVWNSKEFEAFPESLDPDSKSYTVEVTTGDNLVYKNGMVSPTKKAPEYFESTVTVKVVPKKNKWGSYDKNAQSVSLPTVTLNVTYGDEDSYYDSIDSMVEKEFRVLYRNYNNENSDILRTNFANLTDNVIDIPEEYSDLLYIITSVYVDNLFSTISEYRDADDKERTMENKFVTEEAAAFDYLIGFVNSVAIDKTVYDGQVEEMVEYIAQSKAMYNTIITTAYSEHGAVLTGYYKEASKETQKMIDDAVTDLAYAARENNVAAIAKAFRYMF